MDELSRKATHERWARWDHEGSEPPAGYKDCVNCRLRPRGSPLDERREFCETMCPYADLPSTPSAQFVEAESWARKPDPLLMLMAEDISPSMWDLIGDIQQYRKDKRDADMMMAMRGSALG